MKKIQFPMERVVLFFCFCIVAIVLFFCFYTKGNTEYICVIPYPKIIAPVCHIITLIGITFLFFKPQEYVLFALFQIESIISILSGFESIGIFLYYASIFILSCKGFMKNKFWIFIVFTYVVHLAALVMLCKKGWSYTVFYFFISCFYFLLFVYFYYILKTRFQCFTPASVTENKLLRNVKPGSVIHLSDFGLNERQVNLLFEQLNSNASYNQLAEKYFVSLSTVKKEFTYMFKLFNVSKLEELHVLLLQYKIEK